MLNLNISFSFLWENTFYHTVHFLWRYEEDCLSICSVVYKKIDIQNNTIIGIKQWLLNEVTIVNTLTILPLILSNNIIWLATPPAFSNDRQ